MSIRIVTIGGSVRPDNYTAKALRLVNNEFEARESMHLDIVDPAKMKLAMPGLEGGTASDFLKQIVSEAHGVVLATPEYHGSFSSVMKLVIENLGFPSVLAGKPVALLGVAAGQIGAIKSLEHLRSVCSHVGALVLPGPVSVANVRNVFDEAGNCLDPGIEKRIRGVASNLLDYIHQHICPQKNLEQMARERSNPSL